MGYSHLLDTKATLPSFKATYNILGDVDITYCHEGDIAFQRHPHVVFFPLMTILKGEVRFLVDPFILSTLRFYAPTNFPLISTE